MLTKLTLWESIFYGWTHFSVPRNRTTRRQKNVKIRNQNLRHSSFGERLAWREISLCKQDDTTTFTAGRWGEIPTLPTGIECRTCKQNKLLCSLSMSFKVLVFLVCSSMCIPYSHSYLMQTFSLDRTLIGFSLCIHGRCLSFWQWQFYTAYVPSFCLQKFCCLQCCFASREAARAIRAIRRNYVLYFFKIPRRTLRIVK